MIMYSYTKPVEREGEANLNSSSSSQCLTLVLSPVQVEVRQPQPAQVELELKQPEQIVYEDEGEAYEDEEPEDLISPKDELARVTGVNTYVEDEEAVDYTGTLGNGSEALYDTDEYEISEGDYLSKTQELEEEEEEAVPSQAEEETGLTQIAEDEQDYGLDEDLTKTAAPEEVDHKIPAEEPPEEVPTPIVRLEDLIRAA